MKQLNECVIEIGEVELYMLLSFFDEACFRLNDLFEY